MPFTACQSEFFKKFRLEETEVFDNTNPYTIRFEETDGRKRYFVAFTDGQGNFRETEVIFAGLMKGIWSNRN